MVCHGVQDRRDSQAHHKALPAKSSQEPGNAQ